MKIRIAGTVNDSIVDGVGIRFTIFTQGCPHHCDGCHNPETHDFNGGYDVYSAELLEKIKGNPLLDGVTFSGGEPFMQADALADLAVEIKKMGLNIITYTGFTFEELFENRDKNGWGRLLEMSDYLIDGKFEIDKKDWEIKFRGSSNQRYLDCAASLAQGRAVEIEP